MMRWLQSNKEQRVFGLDILRALAILLVLYSHRNLISTTDSSHAYFIYLCGFWGVELFFVLSGFLIGKQLLELIESKAKIGDYWYFLKKRWIRTLPLYFIILGLYFYYESPVSWRHLFFLQNSFGVNEADLIVFPQSWSLTIEEYTYLLLPILFIIISKFSSFSAKHKSLVIILAVIFVSLIARFFYVWNDPQINYDNWIRKATFFRFDAIAFGVLFAWIKIYQKKWFNFFSNPMVPLFVLIIVMWTNNIGNILIAYDDSNILFESSLGFTFISFLIGLCMPFFDSHKICVHLSKLKLINFGITLTAILSYCIYLIHIPIYEFFYKHLDGKIPFKLNSTLMLITIFIIAFISFIFIEKPIQRLLKKRVS